MDNAPGFEINLDEAVYVLSGGLDLVGVDDVQHGKRVAYMALETAQSLGLDRETRLDLYHAALIHDLGVSSTEEHRHLVNELEWSNTQDHCQVAAKLLRRFKPLAHLIDIILHHHTHWDVLKTISLSRRDALIANLIFLADRMDVLRARSLHAGDADPPARARAVIRRYRGTFFDARLVDAFFAVSEDPLFWHRLLPEPLEAYLEQRYPPDPSHRIGLDDIRELADLFAHIVDAKSPYTARHSEGVAQLSCLLADRLHLPDERKELIDVAALLHDLGKLGVPDRILEKPGPLDAVEQIIMRRHAITSYEILERIEGFESVAKWAGLHHETPCGDGYPELFQHEDLPLESRIISVADVFQALAQDRPYRSGLPPHIILSILEREANQGHLDRGIVRLVSEELELCWLAATGLHGHSSLRRHDEGWMRSTHA